MIHPCLGLDQAFRQIKLAMRELITTVIRITWIKHHANELMLVHLLIAACHVVRGGDRVLNVRVFNVKARPTDGKLYPEFPVRILVTETKV